MRDSEGLFTLIKGLSMNEKRYFKIFARINGKKNVNYLDLFNAIDEQDVHNEE